jgi:hypothetical protein
MSSAKAKKPDEVAPPAPEAQVIQIRRVHAYPFEVHIFKQDGVPGVKGQVQKMTANGMLVKLPSISYLSVNGNFISKFELPGLHAVCQEDIKVIKTYQEIADKMFIAEIHFRHLSQPSRDKIQEFIMKSKQKE